MGTITKHLRNNLVWFTVLITILLSLTLSMAQIVFAESTDVYSNLLAEDKEEVKPFIQN